MKKRLLSRRGAAIELAIAVIFLMMALSIILVSIATMQGSHRKKDVADLKDKVERMQVTEDVIDHVDKNNPTEDFEINGYKVKVVDNEHDSEYIVSQGEKVVVTIVIDKATQTITSWN